MSALIRKHIFNGIRSPVWIIPDDSHYHKKRSRNTPPLLFLPSNPKNLIMPRIEYRTTNISEIDLIRPLWIKLNDYMHGKQGHSGPITSR